MGVVGKIATYMGLNDNPDEDMVACMSANGESAFGLWRNKVLFVSDDQDGNNQDGHRYMANSEEHSNTIRENHNAYDVVKIYPDAYLQTSTPGGSGMKTPPRKLPEGWMKAHSLSTTSDMAANPGGHMSAFDHGDH